MSDHYILIGQTPVKCDLMTWATWFETNDRRVAHTMVGPVEVSTVFLGLDHNFHSIITGSPGPPILFETMAFTGVAKPHENCECFHCTHPRQALDLLERCATWLEAEAQHARIVAQFVAEHPQDPVVDLLAVDAGRA